MATAAVARCAEDDPNRCQSTFANGQCPYKAAEYSKYCMMHGGNKAAESQAKRASHDYKVQLWQERIDGFSGSANVKNLRGEIGVLRMTMENTLNLIKTPQQFPLYADKLQGLARDLKGLVEVAQKIEERNKELLSKTEVFNIADAAIAIISKYITDPDDLCIAGEELYDAIIGIASGQDSLGLKSKIHNESEPVGVQISGDESSLPRTVDLLASPLAEGDAR